VSTSLFAATIRSGEVPKTCEVALIGLSDDTGVRLNHGRPGAKDGPRAFREAPAKYRVARPAEFDSPQVFDAGDVIPGADIYETHDRITEAVSALLALNLLPIAVGGGHDLTYPFVRAVAQRYSPLTGVYFDAHLDVRAEVCSGMAFRKIVEECGVQKLHL